SADTRMPTGSSSSRSWGRAATGSEPRMAKGFSTKLIHGGEGKTASLTTPIYETTTFVFNSAEEVQRYNEGGSPHFLYSRYENPTVVAAEEKLAAADGAEAALAFSSGM